MLCMWIVDSSTFTGGGLFWMQMNYFSEHHLALSDLF